MLRGCSQVGLTAKSLRNNGTRINQWFSTRGPFAHVDKGNIWRRSEFTDVCVCMWVEGGGVLLHPVGTEQGCC